MERTAKRLNRPRRVKRRRTRTYAHAHASARLTVRTVSRRPSLSREKWIAAGLLAAVLGLLVLFSTSSLFFVYSDETRFQGLSALSPQEVWQGAGIPDGLSVFFLRTSVLEANLKMLPLVSDAHVTLRFPNRLTINVTEREPKAVWTVGNAQWWVDERGTLLREAGDSPALLTIIDSSQVESVQAGAQMDATAVRSALLYHSLMPDVTVFRYIPEAGLSVRAPQGWTVHLGDDTDAEKKVSILLSLTQYFTQNNLQPRYVDLRVPEAPCYKL